MTNAAKGLTEAQEKSIKGQRVHVPLTVREQVRRAVVAHLEMIEEVAIAEWVGEEHVEEGYIELAAIIRRVRP